MVVKSHRFIQLYIYIPVLYITGAASPKCFVIPSAFRRETALLTRPRHRGMSTVTQMAPDLMLSARQNLHPQQGEAAGTAKESPGGQDLGRVGENTRTTG